MKKQLLLLLALALVPFFTSAQQQWNVPLSLYSKISAMDPLQEIGILVEGDPLAVAAAAKLHQGSLVYARGRICSVQLPAGEVVNFSKEPGIIRIGHSTNNQPLNDTMKAQTRINQVHNGLTPLTQSYKGDGVIMGIIDSGIDFNHPDFKDSLGNTRILKIWDQRDTNGTGPAPWLYGTLWDSAQINGGTCLHNDLAYYGHGTGVSGLAAGNGRSTTARDYSGGAPKSEFIVVALDFNGTYSPVAVADAAAYIYQQAAALGRPCVINASVGDYLGSHDGQDLQAQMIDALLDSAGLAFVCASGNAGNLPIHLSYPLSSDTNFTWFTSTGYNIHFVVWADTSNFNAAKLSVGCTQNGTWIEKAQSPFTTIQSNLGIYSADTLKNAANDVLAVVNRYANIQGSAYFMEFLIVPDSATGYNYSLDLTGGGLFHIWSFDMYAAALPSVGNYPAIAYYKSPDTTHTVCSSFQCSDRTVTVGNYVNRTTWENVNNVWVTDPSITAGDIMWNSSVGPTRDGRLKPEITAPGANTLSCGEISMLPAVIAGAPDAVGVGGYHVVGGGTSASSPVVAGCVALWLQQFPTATWSDVKTAVTTCTIEDSFTGFALPDNKWGYGKVDAFGMMTSCALSVGDSYDEINPISVFPNPVDNGQTVTLNFPQVAKDAQVQIFNVFGQLVSSVILANGVSSATLTTGNWSPGAYMIVLHSGSSVSRAKMIVQ